MDYKKEIPGQAGNDNEAESSAKACFRITEAIKSSPVRGMTKEPSDAETCLHVSISEAIKSSPVRGMTKQSLGMTKAFML